MYGMIFYHNINFKTYTIFYFSNNQVYKGFFFLIYCITFKYFRFVSSQFRYYIIFVHRILRIVRDPHTPRTITWILIHMEGGKYLKNFIMVKLLDRRRNSFRFKHIHLLERTLNYIEEFLRKKTLSVNFHCEILRKVWNIKSRRIQLTISK